MYYPDGRIASLIEQDGSSTIQWEYLYDNTGNFLYRRKDIGAVASHLDAGMMPGTDVNYSLLSSPVENCVGFTIEYEVTKVRKGDGLGNRDLYIYDGSSWSFAGCFSYAAYGRTSADMRFEPRTVARFTTPRVYADDSSFVVEQSLLHVLVADYTYVTLTGAEVLPSLYSAGQIVYNDNTPGPEDMIGQDGISLPSNGWLSTYEIKYVKGTSGNAYLRWSPSNEGREYKRYVQEGERVTVLALENGYSLVKTTDGRAGWVTTTLLADYY